MRTPLVFIVILLSLSSASYSQLSLSVTGGIGASGVLWVKNRQVDTYFQKFMGPALFNQIGFNGSYQIWKKIGLGAEVDLGSFRFTSKSDNRDKRIINHRRVSIPILVTVGKPDHLGITLGYVNQFWIPNERDLSLLTNSYSSGIRLGVFYGILPRLTLHLTGYADIIPFADDVNGMDGTGDWTGFTYHFWYLESKIAYRIL